MSIERGYLCPQRRCVLFDAKTDIPDIPSAEHPRIVKHFEIFA